MGDVVVNLKLPEDVVERAEAAGIEVESMAADLVALLEQRIARWQALAAFDDVTSAMDALSDDVKPTQAEIIAAVRETRKDRAGRKQAGS